MSKNSSSKGIQAKQFRIQLKDVKVSELNPRFGAQLDVGELERSLKRHGLLQPITLRASAGGGYEVVIGSRRFRAILAERGADGFLEYDEFTIVDWPDDIVIRASVAENDQREDLTAVDSGRFLNRLAERDPKMTEEKLARLTGWGGRQRVSELRALASNLLYLPETWQTQLQTPESCRPGDKLLISPSHVKHVRASMAKDGTFAPAVWDLMVKAGDEHWSANQLKTELTTLAKSGNGQPDTDPGAGPAADKKAPAADSEKPTTPDYTRVLKHLRAAIEACGPDTHTVEQLRLLVAHVEKIMPPPAKPMAKVTEPVTTAPESSTTNAKEA